MFHLLFVLFAVIKLTHAKVGIDNCDWEGSGLSDSVIPIDVRCTRGYVKWHYPQGGLRITLTAGSSNKEFRGYFNIDYNTSSFVIVYVQGFRKLHRLYSRDDQQSTKMVRTFVSHGGKAVIYMESKSNESILANDNLQFNYHLVTVTDERDLHSDDSECRPCTEQEMLRLYCESDIVVEGTITSIQNNENLQVSELTVKPTVVHRDLNKKSRLKNMTVKERYIFSHPLKCKAKAGFGSKLLIIGEWILGRPVIRCAPKLDRWKRISSDAVNSKSQLSQCLVVK